MSKVTDNFFSDFPARMSDGRFITNYLPNCQQNFKYQQGMSSWQYRTYLTRMGDDIRKHEMDMNEQMYGYDLSDNTGLTSDMKPPGHKYEQTCDENGCSFKEVDVDGIGVMKVN
jgi:hypothetical protein